MPGRQTDLTTANTVKNKSRHAAVVKNSALKRDKSNRRKAVVLALLLGSLTATSMLLLALAPAPLFPLREVLFVPSSQLNPQDIFGTTAAFDPARWRNIYIHHSKGPSGNALSVGDQSGGLGDHFLIGNGNGCEDGRIQIGRLWEDQQQAHPIGASVDSDYISICLVGDFDQQAPTDRQMQRLEQLVQVLQERCQIPTGQITLISDANGGPGGIGKLFPRQQFIQQLQP
jgi:hypothetical protein